MVYPWGSVYGAILKSWRKFKTREREIPIAVHADGVGPLRQDLTPDVQVQRGVHDWIFVGPVDEPETRHLEMDVFAEGPDGRRFSNPAFNGAALNQVRVPATVYMRYTQPTRTEPKTIVERLGVIDWYGPKMRGHIRRFGECKRK